MVSSQRVQRGEHDDVPGMCDRPDGSPYGVASVTVPALFQP